MAEASTSPDDVRRYVDTNLSDPDITAYIEDADGGALTYNDLEDFEAGELDRLVKFYAAYLIGQGSRAGGKVKQLTRGGRSVTLRTPGGNDMVWLRERIAANDPSGNILGGRRSDRHITFSGSTGE